MPLGLASPRHMSPGTTVFKLNFNSFKTKRTHRDGEITNSTHPQFNCWCFTLAQMLDIQDAGDQPPGISNPNLASGLGAWKTPQRVARSKWPCHISYLNCNLFIHWMSRNCTGCAHRAGWAIAPPCASQNSKAPMLKRVHRTVTRFTIRQRYTETST